MKVLKINVLRGPNFWSINRKKLIQIELDIDFYENFPTNKIDGFVERLTNLIPSLHTHHCSVGTEGGFIERMKEGTWMGHVIEHIVLELQSLAGMECGFGRTRSTGNTGVYNVVFSYLEERAGVFAAEAAVRLAMALAEGKDYDIDFDINALSEIYYEEKLGPSTEAIVDEAKRREIPFFRLDDSSLVMLGQGENQRIVCATVCDSTSSIAVELVQNKQAVKQLLEKAYIPVPGGTTVQDQFQLLEAVNTLGYPVVIKPIDGNHGRGITTNINSEAEATDAFILAKQVSEEVIVERFISGSDFRLLVIDYKLVAAAKRTPAKVTGDGRSTIKELITGTNGKTTTTRLVAHLARVAGYSVGYTTTDGIYLNGSLVAEGDCSGPSSAAVVLTDPTVNYAVLEYARGGILRSGLGFDKCNISIVTNVSEDHLGLNGINDIETLARVKSIVPETTFQEGYAILNADDELVFNMKNQLSCNIALFSLDAENERIIEYCSKGGLAAFVEDGWLTLLKGRNTVRLLEIKQVPITFEGKYDCMIQNTLAATLAATVSNFSIKSIKMGLLSFISSPELNPGRMNIFSFDHFRLIVDYAHNPAGYRELQKYMAKEIASVKIGIIAATGDRRREDIVSIGEIAAEIFDEIIIRHDVDGRGKANEELSALLIHGIQKKHPEKAVHIISDEKEALLFAMETTAQGALIFLTSDDIRDSLAFIKDIKNMNDSSKELNYGA